MATTDAVTPPKPLSRRDQFAIGFAQAILSRQSGRKADALAREVVQFTDAFLAELDKKGN